MPPDARRPLDACYDERSDRINNYNLEVIDSFDTLAGS